MKYVRIRSWHVAAAIVSRAGLKKTRCGRWAGADAPESEDFGAEKSCETCLRMEADEPLWGPA